MPQAVRSGRGHHYKRRSDLRDLEEKESDTSSSASRGESKTDRERRRKKSRLPKYSFPFLSGMKLKPGSTVLPAQQNKSLHVRINNTYIHIFAVCNFSAQVFPLCRILRWQVSLNVPESCGRTVKDGPMWSHLCQQLTWRGNT